MEYKVENLIDSVSKKHTFPDDKIIFLNTSDIEKGYVLHNNYSMIDSLPGQAKKSIQKGDILYSEIRPKNERFAYINFASDDYVVSTKLMVLRNKKPEILNTKYFYIYITSKKTIDYLQNLAESRSGTFPQITFSEVKNMVIDIPTLAVQNKIVNSIESINKKIELNKRIIANLEELSQTLFKRWFVDFEFPDENGNPYKTSGGEMIDSELGKIPKNWGTSTVKNMSTKVISGGTPNRKIEDYWINGDIPWLKTKEINNNIILKTEEYITEEGLLKSSAKFIEENSTVIAMYGATAGKIGYVAKTMTTNQACCAIESDYPVFIYKYFKYNSDYIKTLASGSAQQNLNKKILEDLCIVDPDKKVLLLFEEILNSTIKMMKVKVKENCELVLLRDTLLPKLMSGEIEIPDDIEVNEDELSI
ncbi:restriction endonuclease subunit S [Mammaliicoccus lentus]|uniref:restriction endonuclease subunit S n=1 Tax=Mammaliicoccus lentus TaxID=42858 RepID=UPI002649298B|nr:restriction endonuclease subunit S [Mammaliicoccus lentus]